MTRASFRLPPRTLALAIAAAAFTAFASALPAGFVEWDDHYNFLNNPHYRGLGLAQLRWMLTSAWSGHWTPLTWLTLSADFTVWGMDPFGYHLTGLVLHAATAGVFFFVAARLLASAQPETAPGAIRAGAAVAALVFALHPLPAESIQPDSESAQSAAVAPRNADSTFGFWRTGPRSARPARPHANTAVRQTIPCNPWRSSPRRPLRRIAPCIVAPGANVCT